MRVPLTKMINNLEKIRQTLCAYRQPFGKRCDCKCGINKEKKPEQSGCPELYEAIHLLRKIKGKRNLNN